MMKTFVNGFKLIPFFFISFCFYFVLFLRDGKLRQFIFKNLYFEYIREMGSGVEEAYISGLHSASLFTAVFSLKLGDTGPHS